MVLLWPHALLSGTWEVGAMTELLGEERRETMVTSCHCVHTLPCMARLHLQMNGKFIFKEYQLEPAPN